MLTFRPARPADLPRLTEIYNHYVIHSPATFDLEPKSVDERREWFAQFASTGRYRLIVAEEAVAEEAAAPRDSLVLGYAGATRWRAKPAYSETVETTIYCAPEATGRGIGVQLYEALFEALRNEDVHRIVAGYVPPNEASARLHQRCGFRPVGVFSEVGYKFGRYWDVCWLERPGPAQ